MTTPIISLTTDFGRSDGYVGTMEGVIYGICPAARIAHLSHQIPPQDIRAGAFVLYQSFGYFPAHAVHCVVVDPGVGSQRRAVAVQTDMGTFVAPDNGVLSLVLQVAPARQAVALTNPAYQLPRLSSTFHGRDIFSPAAAHLAAGVPLAELGPVVTDLVRLELLSPPGAGQSRVIHVDHFGNLVLGLTAAQIPDAAALRVVAGEAVIGPLRRTFAEVPEGELLAYIGSSRDHVEIAVRNGNAARRLGLKPGDVVAIEF
ncbi:MAG: SAM-dependent chlorinase/fluorinase [Anaerolineae bacterium]